MKFDVNKHGLEIAGLALAIVGIAIALKNSPAAQVNAQAAVPLQNTPVGAASGPEYVTWNYPSQGFTAPDGTPNPLPLALIAEQVPAYQGGAGCGCGCSEGAGAAGTTLFANADQLAQYYDQTQQQLVQQYTSNLISSMPDWFSQYINNSAGVLAGNASQAALESA